MAEPLFVLCPGSGVPSLSQQPTHSPIAAVGPCSWGTGSRRMQAGSNQAPGGQPLGPGIALADNQTIPLLLSPNASGGSELALSAQSPRGEPPARGATSN